MPGYAPDFLGISLPLPTFSAALIGDVLQRDELAPNPDGISILAHYPNYTLVTNRRLRTPLFSALNIDQNKFRISQGGKRWRIDSRIGADFQLNNDYYASNPWDLGHMARRASAAWGESGREAQRASDETYYFSNASLQHMNFNRDEWVGLEDWVKKLDIDTTNRISVFSGPIFGDFVRSITPEGRDTALIPSAYFKVVAFINTAEDLEVRSFIMVQDEEAMHDRRGRSRIARENDADMRANGGRPMQAFQRYQVSVTEIEERTGLIFPDQIPARNPLFFSGSSETAETHRISHFPERREVDSPDELINSESERRDFILDEREPIYIAAAMVNPIGAEKEGEWISIINLSGEPVNLAGWTLSDMRRKSLNLDGTLPPGEALRVGPPLASLKLGNKGGVIVLRNENGDRIDRVRYTPEQGKIEGRPVVFARRAPEIDGDDS